ncbi:MAG TPA: helicase-exonuclease AddAB subunit AddA [Desulfobacteria bacterium]|nr:helicase-exonuclease AddAB subunit AddA [Desulfobacteria bacterium]
MGKQTWTAEQLAAITTHRTNLLVAAAAGAGKTAVLVERIIRLITDKTSPVDVDRLLVVTFTNAAAAEMRDRIAKAISAKLSQEPQNRQLEKQLALLNMASITTIHSFCLNLLRQHYYLFDLDPAFRIIDDTEGALLRAQALEELFEARYAAGDKQFTTLVDLYGGEREDNGLQDLVLKLYDFARSHPWPDNWLQEAAAVFNLPENGCLDDTEWYKSLKDSINMNLEGARYQLAAALRLALSPGGPAVYADTLRDNLAMLDGFLQAARGNFAGLSEEFSGLNWGRLKSCRKDVDERLKERVKELRDSAKNSVDKLKTLFFNRAEQEFINDLRQIAPVIQALAQLVIDYISAYQKVKREQGLVDFADLEHYCLQILLQPGSKPGEIVPSEVALQLREYYAEILVDEYQDTNLVQEIILQLVSRPVEDDPNLFMVGDVKQSIYRFRLTEPQLFLAKYQRYSLEGKGGERRIDLARNFRSRQEVVQAVNFIFRQVMTPRLGEAPYDRAAELVYGANYPELPTGNPVAGPVELCLIERDPEQRAAAAEEDAEELDAAQLEARVIAGRIKELVNGSGEQGASLVFDKEIGYRKIIYRDIVILLRATKGWANTFLEELRDAGIPAFADLGTGYFEATEVETILSLLKVIDNPQQDIPLAAILRSQLVGLSAEELARIRAADVSDNYYQAVKSIAGWAKDQATGQESGGGLTDGTEDWESLAGKLQQFLTRLEQWRTVSRQSPLSDLIWQIYRETGYFDFVGGLPGGRQRQANLRALHDRARQYEATNFRGLFRFLRFIERLRDSGSDLGAARALGENEDVVRIMSIHKSKGLEFPVVFVAGLGKRFNLQDINAETLLHKDLGIGAQFVDLNTRVKYPTFAKLAIRERLKIETLAEEVRILYVALTRAREKLVLIGTQKGLRNKAEKWCQYINVTGWPLPDAALASATCFLDWLGPAISRHHGAEVLHALAGLEQSPQGEPAGDPSAWRIHLPRVDEAPVEEELNTENGQMAIVSGLQPFEAVPELLERVKARLEWRYPYRSAVGKAAKAAVTEVKRHFDQIQAEETGETLTRQPQIGDRPRFLQDTKGLTAAERGSAIHLVMQQLTLQEALSEAELDRQIDRMAIRELLTPEQVEAIDKQKIINILHSKLGQRIAAAKAVKREVPFSFALPARELYPDLTADCAETVLIQGVIDCLLEEEDGYVLIDWKTDRIRSKSDIKEMCKRYQVQLALYARAVEGILSRPVKEKYLVLMDCGETIRVD